MNRQQMEEFFKKVKNKEVEFYFRGKYMSTMIPKKLNIDIGLHNNFSKLIGLIDDELGEEFVHEGFKDFKGTYWKLKEKSTTTNFILED